MLAVTGRRTTIVAELEKILWAEKVPEQIVRLDCNLASPTCSLHRIPHAERYLLAAGVLHQKEIRDQSWSEIVESLSVNLINVIRICELVLEDQEHARICIIGSHSARWGSFDRTYAAAKAGVHAYVNQRETKPRQQLVCISPPIIADSAMTMRRKDYPAVLERRAHCTAHEVASAVFQVLYECEPTRFSGQVITMKATTPSCQ